MDEKCTDEKAVFVAALAMEPKAERVAYLRETCGGDAALLTRLQALLKAHEEIGDFLEPASLDPDIARVICALAEDVGSIVGPYKLLEVIGEGSVLAGYARHGLNVRKKQLTELIEEKKAAGDREGSAAALSRLDEISRALNGDSDRSGERAD